MISNESELDGKGIRQIGEERSSRDLQRNVVPVMMS